MVIARMTSHSIHPQPHSPTDTGQTALALGRKGSLGITSS